jgi:hypothetical protein
MHIKLDTTTKAITFINSGKALVLSSAPPTHFAPDAMGAITFVESTLEVNGMFDLRHALREGHVVTLMMNVDVDVELSHHKVVIKKDQSVGHLHSIKATVKDSGRVLNILLANRGDFSTALSEFFGVAAHEVAAAG